MGFLSKIFGGGKKNGEAQEIIEETLHGIAEKGGFNFSFDVKDKGEGLFLIEFDGEEEDMFKEKEGQLLDSFQLFLTRVLQHQLPEDRINIEVDCNGFREEANKELIELAEKLKGIVVSKKKTVYFRALPPKDRKVIHQYLADDSRVKSRSIGEGLYKKIKIFPAGQPRNRKNNEGSRSSANA